MDPLGSTSTLRRRTRRPAINSLSSAWYGITLSFSLHQTALNRNKHQLLFFCVAGSERAGSYVMCFKPFPKLAAAVVQGDSGGSEACDSFVLVSLLLAGAALIFFQQGERLGEREKEGGRGHHIRQVLFYQELPGVLEKDTWIKPSPDLTPRLPNSANSYTTL